MTLEITTFRRPVAGRNRRNRTGIPFQGCGVPHAFSRRAGQCPLLHRFAVRIWHRSERFVAGGRAGCLGNRIPRRGNHHLSEKYGTRTYDSGRTVGNGGYRTGLRYGNVCCGRDRHGDDTDGTGGARRLDPTGGNDDREPDFLGRKRASKEWSIRSRTTVSSYIPMN